MDDLMSLLLRAYLMVLGLGMAAHFGRMADQARRTPPGIKAAYVAAALGGFGAAVFAVLLGSAGVPLALISLALGTGGALVVALAAWRAGVKMCEVMDSAAALEAAKKVQSVVGQAQREAQVLGERMTFRTWDALASMEEDPRDKRRPQDGGRP